MEAGPLPGICELLFGCRNYMVWFEPELSLQLLQWRRRSEGVHAYDLPRGANISFPAKGGGLLHGYSCFHIWWQHAFTIGRGLVLENLPRRHRDDARTNSFGEQLLVRLHCKADLAARGDDDHFRISAGTICEHVGSLRNAGGGRILAAIKSWQGLSRQREHRGLVA